MRVVIDACVLYPTVLREIVLGVARADLTIETSFRLAK